MKVLVTGANGFVGKSVCRALSEKGYFVRGSFWRKQMFRESSHCAEYIEVGDVGPATDWSEALKNIDAVVHLVARVHILDDTSSDPLVEHRKINVEGTRRLAEEARKAGVRRFIYVSTVKVNGELTLERPFTEKDTPKPYDDYAISKFEAEEALRKFSDIPGFEVIVLRIPIVYGPGVRANFHRLLKWSSAGLPFPFASVKNRRSLIYLENLADAIVHCVGYEGQVQGTFLVSDGTDYSTRELYGHISRAMNKKAKMINIPIPFLKTVSALTGKKAEIIRLAGSLEIDSSLFRSTFKWKPPFSAEEGINETVKWFKSQKSEIKSA